jgi:hypothetical protein
MATVNICPIWVGQRFANANNILLAGGGIYTYMAGSFSSLQTSYSDSAGSVPNSNPILLDASGLITAAIWLIQGQAYNMVLKDANGNIIDSVDNVQGASPPIPGPPGPPGGVTSIIAGTNVTISPTDGLGDVTINASGGGGSYVPPYITIFTDSNQRNGASYWGINATQAPGMVTAQASPNWSYDSVGGHLVNTSLTENTWFQVTLQAIITSTDTYNAPWDYQFQYGTYIIESVDGFTNQTLYVTPGWAVASLGGALEWTDTYAVLLNSSQTKISPYILITQITDPVLSIFELSMRVIITKIGN